MCYLIHVFVFTGEDNVTSVQCFQFKECPMPTIEDGQILVKTLCLSVDPYMV